MEGNREQLPHGHLALLGGSWGQPPRNERRCNAKARGRREGRQNSWRQSTGEELQAQRARGEGLTELIEALDVLLRSHLVVRKDGRQHGTAGRRETLRRAAALLIGAEPDIGVKRHQQLCQPWLAALGNGANGSRISSQKGGERGGRRKEGGAARGEAKGSRDGATRIMGEEGMEREAQGRSMRDGRTNRVGGFAAFWSSTRAGRRRVEHGKVCGLVEQHMGNDG